MLTLILALAWSAAAGEAGIDWVAIPAGSFSMGSSEDPAEQPRHLVSLKSFDMARSAVTFKQYRACVAAGACAAAHVADGTCWVWNGPDWEKGALPERFQGDDQPVVCVDRAQALAFSKWAGGRLPTEAEREYAASGAGRNFKYPWGSEEPSCDRAVLSQDGRGCGRDATWPVCSKPAGNSAQDLCDLAGNVWEWVSDWHHATYEGAPADGSSWDRPRGTLRAARGGSWSFAGRDLRCAVRGHAEPEYRSASFGFRPVR